MMGVVGLLIGLMSVAAQFLGGSTAARDGLLLYSFRSLFFSGTIGTSFLSLWNAYLATRPRPFCTISVDCICGKDEQEIGVDEMLRDLTAMEMAAYKNNSMIVNLKGTKALQSHRYFFLACLSIIAFVVCIALRQ